MDKQATKFYQLNPREHRHCYSLNLALANFHDHYDPRLEDTEQTIHSARHEAGILCSFRYHKPISKLFFRIS